MLIEYDTQVPPPRQHPWTVVETNPEARYWDFRKHPENIRTALEDFKPWSHYPAVEQFYELLEWMNADETSVFESNDCGLLRPVVDKDTPAVIRQVFQKDPLRFHGRLTFIFRDPAWNVSEPSVTAVKRAIHDALRDNVGTFPAVIKIGDWSHMFMDIGKPGNAIILYLWAWGEDETHAMQNLGSIFDLIKGCLQWISAGILKLDEIRQDS